MKKINDWVIKTFGLRGSWSWAKKQMLNGAIIKRKATTIYGLSWKAFLLLLGHRKAFKEGDQR